MEPGFAEVVRFCYECWWWPAAWILAIVAAALFL